MKQTTQDIKDRQATAFVNRIRALGSFTADAVMVERLTKALARKMTLEELGDLLTLVKS